jgi:hypothetical protein
MAALAIEPEAADSFSLTPTRDRSPQDAHLTTTAAPSSERPTTCVR